jgi:hypothetical protein
MKFLVPNYSCLQNPLLGGYRPQIPVLSVICPQNWLCWAPTPKKFLGTPLFNVYLSVFGRMYVCPRTIDRTFVRVVPYICPSLIKRTSVRILLNEVRFTKQICPDLWQIECRKQFGQNTPEFGSQRPLGGTELGPTRCQVKVQSTTISLHSPPTPHTMSAEHNGIPREYYDCLLFSYQSTLLSERIVRSFEPRDYQLPILSSLAVKVLWCGWTEGCASFSWYHVTLLWHNVSFLCLIRLRGGGGLRMGGEGGRSCCNGRSLRNRWANECKQPKSKCLLVVSLMLCNARCSCCVWYAKPLGICYRAAR